LPWLKVYVSHCDKPIS